MRLRPLVLVLPFLLAACLTASNYPMSAIGTYQGTLSTAASPQILLALRPDGTVSMSTDEMNGMPPLVETGTWRADGPRVIITLMNRALNQQTTHEFDRVGNERLQHRRTTPATRSVSGLLLVRR